MNLDWKRFVTAQTVSFIKNELEPIRRYTPDIPVTTNLMGRSDTLDQWKLAEILDVVSVDSYPEWCASGQSHARVAQFAAFTFDINRSLKKNMPFYVMECTPSQVNWYDVNRLKKPGMNELTSMQAIAHGSESVQYFQWRGARGASEKLHGTVVGHNGKDSTRVFREVSILGEKLKKLDDVVGSITKSDVALIYDWENKWAIGDLMGLTKPLDYDEICEEHYIPFWEEGVSVDIISMDRDFAQYRMIVAPMLYSVRPGVADRFKKFVADGGTLILTFCTAYVNENDLCFLGGFPGDGLMEVAGLEAEEIDALYPGQFNKITVRSEEIGAESGSSYLSRSLCEVVNMQGTCRSLAVYAEDFYKETPAVTVNDYGKGQCYYFATRVEEEFLKKFYHKRIEEKGISRNMTITPPDGVTVQRRQKGDEFFDFILNFTEEEQQVRLDEDIVYVDVLKQQQITEREIVLPAFGYRILSRRREVKN